MERFEENILKALNGKLSAYQNYKKHSEHEAGKEALDSITETIFPENPEYRAFVHLIPEINPLKLVGVIIRRGSIENYLRYLDHKGRVSPEIASEMYAMVF